jgi:D-alanyl-D-alanine carboxypeptidase
MKRLSAFQRLTIAAIAITITAAAARADQVDVFVTTQLNERHIPGAAVAVIRNGKVVKIKGYGVASLEFSVPVTTDTVFEIGSVSKQMTAAGILLLVEEGRVGLDEKISKYLPNTPETWKDVTVRHLLTHSAGIKSYSSLTGFDLIRRLKVKDFIDLLAPHPLEFTPGERNIYSNTGFTLLAYVIESVSGKPYIDFMQERIFRPLGMTRTADRDPQFIIRNRATGYEWNGERYTGRSWDLTDLKGAGSIVSTIEDMVKWDAAVSGNTFLGPSSKGQWWTPFTFNDGKRSVYGFGWRISDIRGHRLIGHTGQTAGFGSANFRYPDHGLTVIALTNNGEIGLGGLIATGIAKRYIPSMSLRAMRPVKDDEGERTALVRRAITERVANRPDPNTLAPELVRALAGRRAIAANDRIAALGKIRSFDLVSSETAEGRTIYRYRADTGKRMFLWRVAFGADGKITEMSLEEEE